MDDDRPLFFHVMAYADSADSDVVDMVSGDPDWEPPAALREGFREYADRPVSEYQYAQSAGLGELREEIAAREGVDVERVIVTNGAGEANYLAMACGLRTYDGDEVILADPVYPYYSGRTRMLDAEPRFVAADDEGYLDPASVEEAASDDTAIIVVNSPNNPTGTVYGEARKRELLEIAEAHDALLLSDEVYETYDYSGQFFSLLDIESEHRVVTNSFSKSMAATGIRVGYAILPEHLIDAAQTRHMLVNVACSRPAQVAALRALRETPESYYAESNRLLADRVDTFTDALDAAGAEYMTPEGGFYVLARFDGFPGTLENVKKLIDDAGVAGMPGEGFGETRTDWIRFALVTPRVEEAADRLAEYFD
ncbi:pyridoxal phosphate-dependent aminotransferase [Natronomonas sp. EA1]|uniref:pyridoxal phosphate-dependent aminotransferase n=1 Tax=Natronomonas sp. EA1 TaxID=3421655 RepID=UPI003EBB1864